MRMSGIFFLSQRPHRVRLRSPREGVDYGWKLRLGECLAPPASRMHTATWIGSAADAFMRAHPKLKAGDCLNLVLGGLYAEESQLCWFIERGELAPPRWPAQAADDGPKPLPQAPKAVSCAAPPLSLSHTPMTHSIVALATVKLHAQAAARARDPFEDACPYPFESAAAGSFKAYYEAELQLMRAELAQSQAQDAAQAEGQPS